MTAQAYSWIEKHETIHKREGEVGVANCITLSHAQLGNECQALLCI